MSTSNTEIKCSVKDCRFNDKTKFCTLHDITVGGTENKVTSKFQTDCMSFETEI